MRRKRAPGAGLKAQGPHTGKSATLTTRITPETRDALDEAARANRRSLSQEIEVRLQASLTKSHSEHETNRALGYVLTVLADALQRTTGKNWRDDAFTGWALS